MKTIISILFTITLISVANSQELQGQKVQDVAKKYDSYYVYKNNSSNLFRTIFHKRIENEDIFEYTYSDKAGIVRIHLNDSIFFEGLKWGILDSISDYSNSDFSENRAAVISKKDFTYGFIDTTGKLVIEPAYNFVGSFKEGLAYFAQVEACSGSQTIENKTGYIDHNNNKIIQLPKELSNLYGCCFFLGENFKNGVALLSIREFNFDCNSYLTIVIDRTGKILNYSGYLRDPNDVPIDLEQFTK